MENLKNILFGASKDSNQIIYFPPHPKPLISLIYLDILITTFQFLYKLIPN